MGTLLMKRQLQALFIAVCLFCSSSCLKVPSFYHIFSLYCNSFSGHQIFLTLLVSQMPNRSERLVPKTATATAGWAAKHALQMETPDPDVPGFNPQVPHRRLLIFPISIIIIKYCLGLCMWVWFEFCLNLIGGYWIRWKVCHLIGIHG